MSHDPRGGRLVFSHAAWSGALGVLVMRSIVAILKRVYSDFFEDDAMTLGGALAFYTALSIALLLLIALLGFIWSKHDQVQAQIVGQVKNLIGENGASFIQTIMSQAGKEQVHGIAAVIGIATLVLGATGVFAQLQYSLNRIWNVKAKPTEGLWGWLRKRLLSLGMIFAIAFLLLVSLVVSAALGFAGGNHGIDLPGGDATWLVINFLVSLLIYVGVFTAIFKYLPDVVISWRDGFIGGLVTAVLFSVGKELLGWYLARGSVSSAYGAAGSFLVVLLWVYYSSLILFVGAEFTQAYAIVKGHPLQPDEHAQLMADPKNCDRPQGPRGARPAHG
jgi:membrane protein